MEDLKARLTSDLSHVKTVWFDTNGNWFLHAGNRKESKSRDEILGTEAVVEVETKKKKIKE
jgi:hypothetical protein